MSSAREDSLNEILTGGSELSNVTADTIAQAMTDFPLGLRSGATWEWVAMAIRRTLGGTLPGIDDGPLRTSNVEIRDQLRELADSCRSTFSKFFRLSVASDRTLWWHGFRNSSSILEQEADQEVEAIEAKDYKRLQLLIHELDWASHFLRGASCSVSAQSGQWRASEERMLRVNRARWLIVIFETAFGEKVSANNYPNEARFSQPTPFMDFYQRVMELVFGVKATADPAGVVKIACRHHRANPMTLSEEFISPF